MSERDQQLREQILDWLPNITAKPSPRGTSSPAIPVPVSGKVIDGADLRSVVDSALDCWFTTGRFAKAFEKKLRALSA